MEKKTVILPQEVWDRLVIILDMWGKRDPDTQHILTMLYLQLHQSPADELPSTIVKNP